jgi:hypothetical protein
MTRYPRKVPVRPQVIFQAYLERYRKRKLEEEIEHFEIDDGRKSNRSARPSTEAA